MRRAGVGVAFGQLASSGVGRLMARAAGPMSAASRALTAAQIAVADLASLRARVDHHAALGFCRAIARKAARKV